MSRLSGAVQAPRQPESRAMAGSLRTFGRNHGGGAMQFSQEGTL